MTSSGRRCRVPRRSWSPLSAAVTGAHPGPLPSSGVFATDNSIAAPALLPDGSVAETSISPTLVVRGAMLDPDDLRKGTAARFAAIESTKDSEEDE